MKFQLLSIATCLALVQAQPITEPVAEVAVENPVALPNGTLIAYPSLIDCSWPCPNPADGCIITNEGAHCAPRGANRWEIKHPLKAPVYTGRPVTRPMDRCQPAPMPQLPAGDIANIPNPGQSVIMWPMQPERRPLDEYLGNCRGGLFCSSAGDDKANPVCRIRYQPGVSCVSSNQCYSGKCLDNVCQPGEDRDDDDDDNRNNNRNNRGGQREDGRNWRDYRGDGYWRGDCYRGVCNRN